MSNSDDLDVVEAHPELELTFSAEIDQIVKAIADFQALGQHAKTTEENPYFDSKYADLANVRSVQVELHKRGVAIIQAPSTDDNYDVVITTLLAHTSGQWIRSRLVMQPKKMDPQGIGSTITYGRRYAVTAMTGIAQEDDDGNEASGRETSARDRAPRDQQRRTAQSDAAWKTEARLIKDDLDRASSQEERDDIWHRAKSDLDQIRRVSAGTYSALCAAHKPVNQAAE